MQRKRAVSPHVPASSAAHERRQRQRPFRFRALAVFLRPRQASAAIGARRRCCAIKSNSSELVFRSESDLLLQLQHTTPPAPPVAARHPQQSSDVLVQMYMLLPLTGTWRVTAGWGKSMLQHIGDIVAVDCSNPQPHLHVSTSHQVADSHALQQAVADTPPRPRLVLPEAFGSDDDEPTAPVLPAQFESNDSLFDALDDVEGAEVEHVLCVQGAAVARSSVTNSSREADAYTHSGDLSFTLPQPTLTRAESRRHVTGGTLSVAVLCPRVVADQQHIMSTTTLAPSSRVRGGSWMITTSPAPLMLLPESDVAQEAARSFPSLLTADGFGGGSGSAGGSSNVFSGLFVGCAVISSRDETAFPSPWPLDITSRARLCLSYSCLCAGCC